MPWRIGSSMIYRTDLNMVIFHSKLVNFPRGCIYIYTYLYTHTYTHIRIFIDIMRGYTWMNTMGSHSSGLKPLALNPPTISNWDDDIQLGKMPRGCFLLTVLNFSNVLPHFSISFKTIFASTTFSIYIFFGESFSSHFFPYSFF